MNNSENENKEYAIPRRRLGLGMFLVITGIAMLVWQMSGLNSFTAAESSSSVGSVVISELPVFSLDDINSFATRIEVVAPSHYSFELYRMPERFDPKWEIGDVQLFAHQWPDVPVQREIIIRNIDGSYAVVFFGNN